MAPLQHVALLQHVASPQHVAVGLKGFRRSSGGARRTGCGRTGTRTGRACLSELPGPHPRSVEKPTFGSGLKGFSPGVDVPLLGVVPDGSDGVLRAPGRPGGASGVLASLFWPNWRSVQTLISGDGAQGLLTPLREGNLKDFRPSVGESPQSLARTADDGKSTRWLQLSLKYCRECEV